ncbi:MAG: pyruvate dehydrogenase complex E1 component subunit beta [Myxococcota bacterium]
MAEMQFREALGQAIAEEMERDPRVFIMGEEVAEYNGAYKVTKGLLEKFGPKRVIDTPISEAGFAGIGIGAAMVGLRPIVEVMTFNFSLVAFDQIINSAAKMRYMSGGQYTVPMVFRGPNGAAHMLGGQHSTSVEALYGHFPGLKVVYPSTPADGKGLLKSAIRDDNPVLVLESELMYSYRGEVPDGEYTIPFGKGDIIRPGKDVTIVTVGKMRFVSLDAAKILAEQHGIDVEVIDLRSIRPMDEEIFVSSVKKTNRCVVVEENYPFCGIGAQIAYVLQRDAFDYLDAPVERVTSLDVPMPYADNLEHVVLPSPEKVVAAVKKVLYRG